MHAAGTTRRATRADHHENWASAEELTVEHMGDGLLVAISDGTRSHHDWLHDVTLHHGGDAVAHNDHGRTPLRTRIHPVVNRGR